MKKPDRQHLGFLLIGIALLVAVIMQWLGPGLVVVDHPAPPPPIVTPSGIKVVTGIQKTRIHFALIPLVAVGIIGFILAMIPRRDEHSH
jgi:hypothetical protein